jgi:hypothetical protein
MAMSAVLWLAVLPLGLASPATAAQEEDPAAAVRQLLDGWRNADFERASAVLAPEFRLLTLRRDPAGPRLDTDTREHLLGTMRGLSAGVWDVRLGKLAVQRHESGIATAWAPYTFYISGKKSHCGVEAYTLYRLKDGWRIVEFADTHLWTGSEAACLDRAPS